MAMVLIALLVLLGAVLVVRRFSARSAARTERSGMATDRTMAEQDATTTMWFPAVTRTGPFPPVPPPASEQATAAPTHDIAVMTFLVALGEAMIDSADPVTHIGASLQKVAAANGAPEAQIVIMPTALFVSVPSGATTQTAVATAGAAPLRLDQVDAVFEVVRDSERGHIGPVEGLARIAQARSLTPEFTPPTQAVGYVGVTLGLALILQASWTELAVALVLGAAVGGFEWWASRFSQPLQVFVPVASALGVATSVFLLGRAGLDVSGYSALIAPLVTFIPGALLTTGVIELATGQIVSGAGRLAAGGMRLVLLAIGILAGAQFVGVPAASAEVTSPAFGPLGPWLGVAVFGIGVVVNKCARRAALGWILLVLYVAFAGQVIGGLLLGGSLSAFCGALAMTPVALFVANQKSGPTSLVTFLPAFWLLVPGAVALVGVTTILGDEQDIGWATLVSAAATMVSIALGIMLGLVVSSVVKSMAGSQPERGS